MSKVKRIKPRADLTPRRVQLPFFPDLEPETARKMLVATLGHVEKQSLAMMSLAASTARLVELLEKGASAPKLVEGWSAGGVAQHLAVRLSDMSAVVQQLLADEVEIKVKEKRGVQGHEAIVMVRKGSRTGDARLLLIGEVESAQGVLKLFQIVKAQGLFG